MNQTSNTPNLLNPDGQIAFIQGGWHKDIVEEAQKSFCTELQKNNIPDSRIEVFNVPGALEIPLQAKLLALTGKYAVIVGCGFVVDGGIYRHDFVASSIIDGFMQVQLETQVPILSVVLTPHHFHEHEPHHDFFFNHFKIKGQEAAQACVQTLENLKTIQSIYERSDTKQAA